MNTLTLNLTFTLTKPNAMLTLIFRKWWIILLQGLLLILLSIYMFNNPETVLTAVSIWLGVLILGSGLLGLASLIGDNHQENKSVLILWSLLTAMLGVVLLAHLSVTMKILTIFLGIWIFVSGLRIASAGWRLKEINAFGWIVTIAGIMSIIAGVIVILNLHAGALGIGLLLGMHAMVTGIALILLAVFKRSLKKKIVEEIKDH